LCEANSAENIAAFDDKFSEILSRYNVNHDTQDYLEYKRDRPADYPNEPLIGAAKFGFLIRKG
jgi:hypothetical protein